MKIAKKFWQMNMNVSNRRQHAHEFHHLEVDLTPCTGVAPGPSHAKLGLVN